MNLWFWAWVALAVIFAVAELIEEGWFIGPWAVGAVSAALLEYLSQPINWQWVAFLGVSVVTFVAIRRIFYPVGRASDAEPVVSENGREPR